MASPKKLFPIMTNPGIKRDGTIFDGNYYISGEWMRFQRGKPRKIGGFRQMTNLFQGICRGGRIDTKNGTVYTHAGSAEFYQQGTFNFSGVGGNVVNRTPAGYVPNDLNMWQHTVIYDGAGTAQIIVAQASPNLQYIDNQVELPAYYGDAFGTAPLVPITGSDVSGGVCAMFPYLFLYSHDGRVVWSVENDPTDLSGTGSGEARITGGKIVKAIPSRAGSGNAPAGLFWATDALVRCTFVGGAAIFNFDRISQGYSILSSESVIDYDGTYYWVGIDRFLYFDGTIRELPNDMNINWFFDGLNKAQRQKVFGYKVPRYGEIWWCYPRDDAEECTHAVVFNVREKTWYDTPLPDSGRSAGYTDSIFQWPVMFGVDETDGFTQMWQHEYGVDKIGDSITRPFLAIKSSYQTADISFATTGPTGNEIIGEDKNVFVSRLEPDFVLSGNMIVTPIGRPYAQSDFVEGNTYTFDSTTQKIDMREQFREIHLYFESNEVGGDYQAGQTLIQISAGDGRPV